LWPRGHDAPYGAFFGWTYQNTPPVLLSAVQAGETHVYYTRVEGPPAVLAELRQKQPERLAEGPDGRCYLARTNGTPEAHLLAVLRRARVAPLFTGPLDSLTEQAGFTYGMAAQGVDDVKGVLQLMWLQQTWHTRLAFYLSAHRAVRLGQATDQQYELVVGVAQTAESLSAFVQTSWNLWQAVQQSQWGTIMAAAGGDLEEAWAQSETCRWLAVYMVELMVALNNQYQESSAFKRGEIKGRITLEVAMIVLPFTKAANAAQLSKVAMLTRLSEVAWIRENPQLLNLILRVLELAKGQQAVPPVIGLPPPRLPPPLVANAEVGGAAERIWGRMTAKMAEGKPRRVALMEAMSEAVANAGDNVVTLRFKEMQDLLLARAPQQFATREEAAQFLADLLTYLQRLEGFHARQATPGRADRHGRRVWGAGGQGGDVSRPPHPQTADAPGAPGAIRGAGGRRGRDARQDLPVGGTSRTRRKQLPQPVECVE
jgi:hypothetical protein